MAILRPISVCAILLALVLTAPAALAEGATNGWTDVAEFSLVASDGNAKSTSLGFKNTLAKTSEKSLWTFNAGGIRVESTTFNRSVVGGVPVESESSDTTAESYYLNGRYDRKITDSLFWFGGAGWDRNEPAGIKDRYIAEAGLGNTWFESDDHVFKTLYGVTFTDQEDTSGVSDDFLGARFSWDYLNKLGANTTYTNVLVLDANLDESSDWRGNMQNGLAVAMSEKLALKLGLQLLYDNEPAILLLANDVPPPEFVPFQLDELDTIFTASLVVNFK